MNRSAILERAKKLSSLDLKNIISAIKAVKETAPAERYVECSLAVRAVKGTSPDLSPSVTNSAAARPPICRPVLGPGREAMLLVRRPPPKQKPLSARKMQSRKPARNSWPTKKRSRKLCLKNWV